jgi:hypothetical protein
MITNFDSHTQELNEYEEKILQPIVIQGLSTKIGKSKAITNKKICEVLTSKDYDITDTRLRKIIHNIRANDLLPLLIATSRGYYVSNNEEEIRDYIKSLSERINSINFIKQSIQRQFHNRPNENQTNLEL